MNLLDRYIVGRFVGNFAILFVLLFLFAVSIDLILALDEFIETAQDLLGDDAGAVRQVVTVIRLAFDFQAPRFFQFFAYLHGIVAVGAMGFTLAQMHRYRELLAILAAGVSMHRIAMPFIVVIFGLSLAQLVNQEFLLPRIAPLLLRDHGHIGRRSVEEFPVRFTPDGRGALFQSPSFDPLTDSLAAPTVLDRDDRGRTRRRVTADRAVWAPRPAADGSGTEDGWVLEGGREVTLQAGDDAGGVPIRRRDLDFYPTDLSPRVLIVRRFGEFAAMLSLHQITQMLETPGVVEQEKLRRSLLRHRYARFSVVLVNVLVMWMALPTFLLRQPANLLRQSMLCAGVTIPALFGSAIFMAMDLPGIPPAVGVFLPVVILIPVVLAQWTYMRT